MLVTTVGPYARYGLPVVEACARDGTHYADLTGEVLLRPGRRRPGRRTGAETGARIVHACGYDSIPSDLSVLLLAERARADGAGGLTDVRLVATIAGGFSGGTIDSMRAQLEALQQDPARRRVVGDPFALSPDRPAEPDTRQPRDAGPPQPDAGRPVDGAVRDGAVQHPHRPPQQRRCRTGPTVADCATTR